MYNYEHTEPIKMLKILCSKSENGFKKNRVGIGKFWIFSNQFCLLTRLYDRLKYLLSIEKTWPIKKFKIYYYQEVQPNYENKLITSPQHPLTYLSSKF